MGKTIFKIKKILLAIFRGFVFFLTVLFLLNPADSLLAERKGNLHLEYRPENIYGFARYLISQKEYYRALIELKRLQIFYPEYLKKEYLYVSEIYLLFKGKRFDRLLEKEYNDEDLVYKSIDVIFKYDAYLHHSNYAEAKSLLSRNHFSYNNNLDEYLIKRLILTDILINRVDSIDAVAEGIEKYRAELKIEKYRELISYSSGKYSSLKKPGISLLYGIIPGMGYVYSERRATGILTLIVVSIFSTITYFSFKTDNRHIGIFLGAATTFFYTGSIVGGYLESRKYNKRTIKSLEDYLVEELSLEDDRDEIFKRYGLPD